MLLPSIEPTVIVCVTESYVGPERTAAPIVTGKLERGAPVAAFKP
jgi:hypothetical protein